VNRTDESGIMGHLLRITLGICLTVFSGEFGAGSVWRRGNRGGHGYPWHARIRSAEERIRFRQSNRIGVGAAAAGAGVLFLALHHRGGVTGMCAKD